MSKKQVNRRLFLQGIGGVTVAAPFLSTLFSRPAIGQSVADPKRLIVFFTHYGCITNRWFPAKSHGALTAADYMGTTLEPLAPFSDKLLMVRGVRAMNEWSFQQELGQETDPHTQVMNGFFTGCPTDGWSGLGTNPPAGVNSATPKRKSNGKPVGGRSLDHVCAEQINRTANPTPLYIGIGGAQNSETNTMTSLSYSTAGVYDHASHSITTPATLYPSIGNPTTIYNNIADLFGSGSTPVMTEGSYAVAQGAQVLDLCRDDLQRIKAKTMSAADRLKLDAWEALLVDTTNMMDMGTGVRLGCSADIANMVGVSDQALQAGASNKLDMAMPVMLALATLSALCDDNRVIFMKTPGNGNYTFLPGVTMDHHSLSHRQGDAGQGGGNCVSNVNNLIATIDSYHAESFAKLVKMLDDVPEGDGKLLDNTATIWFQELSDGNSHNLNNMPILQAGGCGGYFKVGQAVNVDDGAADMSPGTSEALCQMDGGPVPSNQLDSTGTPKEIANAPINKYFYNLMNALGVKAGADGFPVKGGTEVVSRFGMYDDTKDYINFLKDAPPEPAIKDPGEFEALKAGA